MISREAFLVAITLLATPLLALAAGNAGAAGGDTVLTSTSLSGSFLGFAVEGSRMTGVTAAGHPVLANVTLTPGPSASSVEALGGAIRWVDDEGRTLATASDLATPGLRFTAGANTTLSLQAAPGGLATTGANTGTRLTVGAVTALFATEGGRLDRTAPTLDWAFPEGGTLTVTFIIGNTTTWTRTAAAFLPGFYAELTRAGNAIDTAVSPPGSATPVQMVPGDIATLTFTLPKDERFHTVHVKAGPGVFGEAGLRQIVPEVTYNEEPDPLRAHNFAKSLKASDMPEVNSGWGPFYNVSRQGDTWSFTLLILGKGSTTLQFVRDLTPPHLVGTPRLENITHGTLFAYTTTSEWGFVTFTIQTGNEEPIPFPTSVLSLEQTFPIQGLRPDTPYRYTITATDVAGNEAEVATGTFRTLPKPVGPKAEVTQVYPPEGTVLSDKPPYVEAKFEGKDSPVVADQVRLFINKREVHRDNAEGLTITDTGIRYEPPGGFGPGKHSVAVEVTNAAGETTVKQWTFTVESGTPSPGPAIVALAVLAAALLLFRRRK